MKKIVVASLLSTILAACSELPTNQAAAPQAGSETERLNAWFEEHYEEQLQFSPIQLAFQGRKDRYDEFDSMTLAAIKTQFAWLEEATNELKASFDYNKLSPAAKTSYDLWLYQYEREKAGLPFTEHNYNFNQMFGMHTFFTTFMINLHRVDTPEDMQAYISRLKASKRAYSEILERTQNAAKQGIRPPKFSYEIVIEEIDKQLVGAPFDNEADSPLWNDAKTKIAALVEKKLLTEEKAKTLEADAKAALLEFYLPAMKQVRDFLSEDIANTSEQAKGVYALPNGEAYYKYRLQEMTTTEMTADEIHQLGLKEVERLRKEMIKVKDQSGYKGDLQAFFKLMREAKDDTRFYYPDTDAGRQAYIDDATQAINSIEKQLPNYFGLLPKAALEVKRVEAYREQDGAAQHYRSGTPDGSRPGIYYAHLSDMTAMPKAQLEVIAYHEGLPGHHMQISIAQELESVPNFRKHSHFTAYIEGWALYSEYLATEMADTYPNVYSDFGRLTSEIWRAIRLVVDTGLHAKGWSEQQAIDYFAENSPEPLESIRSEVRRYLVLPAQATSYKIGMLDILRLRAESKQALGDKFDIKSFHDTVLGGGALPLKLLDRQVKAWQQSVLSKQG